MKLAVTGHRPPKLFTKAEGPYTDQSRKKLERFATMALRHYMPDCVLTGMALGWDQAVAQACVDLQIPFVAACPCRDQQRLWWPASQAHYIALLEFADEVVYVKDGPYDAACLQLRNEWLVDRCDEVLALYDGSGGGTANCVAYAQQQGKSVHNVWKKWQDYHIGQRRLPL